MSDKSSVPESLRGLITVLALLILGMACGLFIPNGYLALGIAITLGPVIAWLGLTLGKPHDA